MALQPKSDGRVSMRPNTCNMTMRCEICEVLIPAGEEYYEVQVDQGTGFVCHRHELDEAIDWADAAE